MRLTLRTMLAYLDDVLDPADAEVLGKKISQSDFASRLAQQVKTVTKKVRMGAPRLDGKGMGNDANTVAEYLDSTLPQDRVGDFERVCLESDKHLSEVAACHQILTLVLGKPADVPPKLRERIYALGDPEKMAAASPVTPPPVQVGGGANGRPAVAKKPAEAEVPEYLRAGRRSNLLPLIATIAATFLIAAVVLRAMGPFDGSHPVLRMLRGGGQVAQNQAPDEDPNVSPPAPLDTRPPETAPPATTPPTTPPPDGGHEAAATNAAPAPVDVAPPAAVKTGDTGEPITPAPAVPPPAAPDVPAVAATPAADVPPPPPPPAIDAGQPVPAAPEAVAAADPGVSSSRRPLMPPTTPEATPPPMDVGRFTSDGQVLATLDPTDSLWRLKPALGALVAGEQLVSLPTYRPQLTLPTVQLTFAGDGALRLAEPSEGNISNVTVDQGKLLVVAVGAMGSQIDLNLSGIKGLLTLVDADSAVAIKVVRWLPPGTDPLEGRRATVVELFNTHGRVTWQEPGQPKVEIPTHQVYSYAGDNPPVLEGPFVAPGWTDSKSVPPIDRQASLELESMLPRDRPLNLSLREALQFRKVEVRSLAARCLACLNEFEPILKELSDPRQYSYWTAEVDLLQRALHHSPQAAADVKAAIEHVRPADSPQIYRLLWGYSQEQLERTAAAELVKFLEHEQMDIRVLAYENLLKITGAGELYRPERSPSQQRAAIQNWKERQNKGTIAYRLAPTPLENYKPLAAPAAAAEVPVPPRGAPAAPLP